MISFQQPLQQQQQQHFRFEPRMLQPQQQPPTFHAPAPLQQQHLKQQQQQQQQNMLFVPIKRMNPFPDDERFTLLHKRNTKTTSAYENTIHKLMDSARKLVQHHQQEEDVAMMDIDSSQSSDDDDDQEETSSTFSTITSSPAPYKHRDIRQFFTPMKPTNKQQPLFRSTSNNNTSNTNSSPLRRAIAMTSVGPSSMRL